MTREEAIKILEQFKKCLADVVFDEKGSEAWQMAIKALEQEPCDDAISREELLKAIDTWDKFGCDADTKLVRYQEHYVPYIHYDDVVKCIKGMPPVRPQEQTGHWKRISMDRYTTHAQYWYKCDKCGKDNLGNTDWCPNCGAKMVEPQESEDKE